MSNICAVCGKPLFNDNNSTATPELCSGHSARIPDFFSEVLTSEPQPDYSLVLERIAIALEDIVTKLGYISGVY